MIAQSPLNISLGNILSPTVLQQSEFLRQQSRPLKQTTFETLLALVESYGSQMDANLLNTVPFNTQLHAHIYTFQHDLMNSDHVEKREKDD
jgi:hypothetical protein